MEYEALTGPEKVAIVILSSPPGQARELLALLEDAEIEKALAAVSRMDQISSRVQSLVLQEFEETLGRSLEQNVRGGREQAIELVTSALDPDRAKRVLENLGRDAKRIDWTLRSYQPAFIADRLGEEHPQTVALVLSQIPADRGASVLEALPDELRSEVVLRLASLEAVSTEVVSDLELGVAELFARRQVPTTRAGGASLAANVLNRVPKDGSASILEQVEVKDSDAALNIRKRMLTFDDLVHIDKRGFQTFLREIATEDLAIALKTASDEMKEQVFANMSSRAVEQIQEEVDLLGPMPISEVERTQQQIVEIARQLESEGRLSIEIGGSGEILV